MRNMLYKAVIDEQTLDINFPMHKWLNASYRRAHHRLRAARVPRARIKREILGFFISSSRSFRWRARVLRHLLNITLRF